MSLLWRQKKPALLLPLKKCGQYDIYTVLPYFCLEQSQRITARCENNKNTVSDYKYVVILNSVVMIFRFSTLTVLAIVSVNTLRINYQ